MYLRDLEMNTEPQEMACPLCKEWAQRGHDEGAGWAEQKPSSPQAPARGGLSPFSPSASSLTLHPAPSKGRIKKKNKKEKKEFRWHQRKSPMI